MYVFIGLQHCLLPEAAIRVEVFCKNRGFRRKTPVLESLFNKVAGLTPILKNICQRLLLHCTFALHSHHSLLIIRFTLYSAPSSSSLLLLTVNISDVCFDSNSKGFKEFKSGISFSLKSLSCLLFSFSMFFSIFLNFVSFLLVTAEKKDSF